MMNIYLVGFMGAGKTSVGMRLAEILNWRFIDLDREIENREDRPIRESFRAEGESYFRQLERAELARVSGLEGAVVALGGGAFVDARNRETVRTSGISVWLDAPMDILYPRCAGDPLRPLVAAQKEMETLLAQRRPFYEQAAVRIEVDSLTVDEIAHKIRATVRL
jgi:shikimate kinase